MRKSTKMSAFLSAQVGVVKEVGEILDFFVFVCDYMRVCARGGCLNG
jgi:hypothetical protein